MPTRNRAEFVRRKAREEYEANREEVDPVKVREIIDLGEFQLDSVRVQAKHLTENFNRKGYHNDVEVWDKPSGFN